MICSSVLSLVYLQMLEYSLNWEEDSFARHVWPAEAEPLVWQSSSPSDHVGTLYQKWCTWGYQQPNGMRFFIKSFATEKAVIIP